MNWQELSATSPYRTAVAVEQELQRGNVQEAAKGMEELIEALARSEKRALKSQLIRLMVHILKWKAQPAKRSRGWRATIYNARQEITDIQEETPSLTRAVVEAMWDKCFQAAKREAEAEIDRESAVTQLSWEDVFDVDYEEA